MVGFPHSEIPGSKLIRSSPRLIAAYYVLHRLHAPRHPLDALKALDRSHYRCPQLLQRLLKRCRLSSGKNEMTTPLGRGRLIGQIKNNQNSRAVLSLSGVRFKQAAKHLFTMSKDPAEARSKDRLRPNLLSVCDVIGCFGVRHPTTKEWWSQTGSNRRHPACKAGALPAELWPHHGDLPAETGGPG